MQEAEIKAEEEAKIKRILSNGGISPQYINLLKMVDLLDQNRLFITPPMTISYRSGVPLPICNDILSILSTAIISQTPIIELKEPEFTPKFHDDILDKAIPLPDDGIIEFVGPAGSGKSNLIYHIAISQICYDSSRKVVLISTEGRVSTERMQRICECRGYDPEEVFSYLLIRDAKDVSELCKIVNNDLPELFTRSESPPSLVIIDSIAALFRAEFDVSAAIQRSQVLFEIANTLKWLSHSFRSLIITTNQVTANMSLFSMQEWVPSLGLAWSNCVSARIRLTKTSIKRDVEETIPSGPGETATCLKQVTIRNLYVEISPRVQDVKVSFYISDSGVHGA